ncbi:monooxygenase [Streptomyces sp. AJS327]|uniref:FAD-dependent monooxygenase n=1 Tax=Streptomyces sp. AJS327 TaxID=2545265 RepID=UPI0015DD77EE|nr:FAD-dependent monooxygenase [Streptomyces sp. AJS327]MBA0051923.1 monooxygenase [Streptomyces sp. AJS327]
MSDSAVLVVGAGPTGLALALALARHAVPSIVLDATDGAPPRRATRSCVLRPDTAAWLPTVDGARWPGWRIQRRRQLVRHLPLEPGDSPVHLEQHALERALRDALGRETHATIVSGGHVDHLEQDADGITAHTREPNGAWWRGSFLVGCDGARSTVRKLLGVRFAGRTAVERHAVAALRTRLPWEGEALLHRDPGGEPGEVTARPLPGGVWRLDWLLPPRGELVTPEELLDRIHDTLAVWCAEEGEPAEGHPYELLDTGVHISHQRLARHWRVERAFLAGDAAHLEGALGVSSVDEGLRDAANLAWKLALAWHGGHRGTATETLLDSYETERRGAVGARLRAVDQVLPLVRRGGGLRTLLPGGGARAHLELLADCHLGRGPLGGPPRYARSPLAPARETVVPVPVATTPGSTVADVPVTSLSGERGRLRGWLGGAGDGGELLVVLVAPGTGVWDSRHWRSAGMMPELAATVRGLPLRAELLVAESYPGAAAHTVLAIRPDGHLVAALPAARTGQLRACAEAVSGGAGDRGQLAS